jgi:hypothetical protein
MVESLGYRIRVLFVGVFVVGSALAGLGGVMWGLYQQNVIPQMGAQVNILIFIVLIIGGLGSTTGALIGALLVGLMANYTGFLVPKAALFSNIALMMAMDSFEIQRLDSGQGEYYYLLTATCLGGYLLASATNLLMIYLALETLSLTSYALAGYLPGSRKSAEAGMKYVIYGAGAMGATIGARLHVAGHEVVLVALGRHLEALQRDGLHLRSPSSHERVRIPSFGSPAEAAIRPDDVVLLTMKAQDTETALVTLAAAAPALRAGSRSIRNAERRHSQLASQAHRPATSVTCSPEMLIRCVTPVRL